MVISLIASQQASLTSKVAVSHDRNPPCQQRQPHQSSVRARRVQATASSQRHLVGEVLLTAVGRGWAHSRRPGVAKHGTCLLLAELPGHGSRLGSPIGSPRASASHHGLVGLLLFYENMSVHIGDKILVEMPSKITGGRGVISFVEQLVESSKQVVHRLSW